MGNGKGLFGRRVAKSAGVEVNYEIVLCKKLDTSSKVVSVGDIGGGIGVVERTEVKSYHHPFARSHFSKTAFL